MKLTLYAISLSLLISLNACSKHADPPPKAPAVTFRTLQSATPLALYDIKKPTLVNFWSTTCIVCLKEMPELVHTYEQYQPLGFEMIAVAMSYDRPSDVLELAAQRKWPFVVAIDLDGKLGKAFNDVKFTPTSFLINAEGRIVKSFIGKIDMDALRSHLDKLTVKS